MAGIHQFLPNLDYGDAISNYALELRELIRSKGIPSRIYVQHFHPRMSALCSRFTAYDRSSEAGDTIIYHHSISSEVAEYVMKQRTKKILIYHNITPASYMERFNSKLDYLLTKGKNDLKAVGQAADMVICDSDYNAEEMSGLGCECVVVPFLYNPEKLVRKPDENTMRLYSDGKTNVLFVGRIAPNKRQEDVIKVFHIYHRWINSASRLFLIGPHDGLESYRSALQRLIDKLGLNDKVILTGRVRRSELAAYYGLSRVFLSMSEHEGFCVPLLEAMSFDIPVLALGRAAVPFTMDGAGILIHQKRFDEIAEMLDMVARDTPLRERIIRGQRERLERFKDGNNAERLWKCIEEVAG